MGTAEHRRRGIRLRHAAAARAAAWLLLCLAAGARAQECMRSPESTTASCPYPQCENGAPSRVAYETSIKSVDLNAPAQAVSPSDLRGLTYITRMPTVERNGVFPSDFRIDWKFDFGKYGASLDVYFVENPPGGPPRVRADGGGFSLAPEALTPSNQLITIRDRFFCRYQLNASDGGYFEASSYSSDLGSRSAMQRTPLYMFARLNAGTLDLSGTAVVRAVEAWFPAVTSVAASPSLPVDRTPVYVASICGPVEGYGATKGSMPQDCKFAWAATAGQELVGYNVTLRLYLNIAFNAATKSLTGAATNGVEKSFDAALTLAGADAGQFPPSFPSYTEELYQRRWIALDGVPARGPFHVFLFWGPGRLPPAARSANVYVRAMASFARPTPPPTSTTTNASPPPAATSTPSMGQDDGTGGGSTTARSRSVVEEPTNTYRPPSGGLIAGAVVGSIAGVAILIVAGVYCFRRHVLQRREALGGAVGPTGFSTSTRGGQNQMQL